MLKNVPAGAIGDLIEKGMSANISALLQDLQERDARDAARSVAPLQKCADAKLLDTTSLSIGQAVQTVLDWYQQRQQVAGVTQ